MCPTKTCLSSPSIVLIVSHTEENKKRIEKITPLLLENDVVFIFTRYFYFLRWLPTTLLLLPIAFTDSEKSSYAWFGPDCSQSLISISYKFALVWYLLVGPDYSYMNTNEFKVIVICKFVELLTSLGVGLCSVWLLRKSFLGSHCNVI